MLQISRCVITNLQEVFLSRKTEQGFILGSNTCFGQIDFCYQVPALHSENNIYIPNADAANEAIKIWASKGICFCGFIHSHVVDKEGFSASDILFFKKLLDTYKLPSFFLGLGIVKRNDVKIVFYSAQIDNGELLLEQENLEILNSY